MPSPGLHPTPKTPVCPCGEPIEIEMERDRHTCLECQSIGVPDILKREVDNYPGLNHHSVMLGYVLGTLKPMVDFRDCTVAGIHKLILEIEATRQYIDQQRDKRIREHVFGSLDQSA